ncbi:MAG TPA: 5'/3'-nucleotidase SurE [Rariglobus sp.]|jgi:5'-nucleotidase|nr:5'/3'-nucleotidase SurE [Rariglobus sp.]
MRLLLTNDDSIESHFLYALIQALRAAGHDLIIAVPKTEQSWIGCAKSRHRPVTSSARTAVSVARPLASTALPATA